MKLEFSGKVFEKYPNIKFYGNPYSGSRVVSCGETDGRTDRYDEANSRFFRNFVNAPKKTNTALHMAVSSVAVWAGKM